MTRGFSVEPTMVDGRPDRTKSNSAAGEVMKLRKNQRGVVAQSLVL